MSPDAEILDWLDSKMKPGKFLRLCLSDARDIGYTEDFISAHVDNAHAPRSEVRSRAFSVRSALLELMRAETKS